MTDTLADPKYKTQRAEDAALGRPLAKWMKEDPHLRGCPLFLQHQNRRGLTPKEQAAWNALRAKDAPRAAPSAKLSFDRPLGMTDEEWERWGGETEETKRAKTEARIAALRAAHPPKPPKPPRPTTADLLAGAVIRLTRKDNPYREGSTGHAFYALYKDGMTPDALAKKAAGLTGKRRPADLLMHDVRKGHVKLEKKESEK